MNAHLRVVILCLAVGLCLAAHAGKEKKHNHQEGGNGDQKEQKHSCGCDKAKKEKVEKPAPGKVCCSNCGVSVGEGDNAATVGCKGATDLKSCYACCRNSDCAADAKKIDAFMAKDENDAASCYCCLETHSPTPSCPANHEGGDHEEHSDETLPLVEGAEAAPEITHEAHRGETLAEAVEEAVKATGKVARAAKVEVNKKP